MRVRDSVVHNPLHEWIAVDAGVDIHPYSNSYPRKPATELESTHMNDARARLWATLTRPKIKISCKDSKLKKPWEE